ncbi:MAG: hypothetical protein R8J84_00055 [Mariprofundales bacterium]
MKILPRRRGGAERSGDVGLWARVVACCFALLFVAVPAQALEVRGGVVWWQYEEIADQAGYLGTPFHSKASTFALDVAVVGERSLAADWSLYSQLTGLVPVATANERWPLSGWVQTNDLRIAQIASQLSLVRHFGSVDAGISAALQWHQQARKQFKKNGVPLPDGLVTETVRTAWLGGVIASHGLQLQAALPLWVHTTNSSIGNTFSKRDGFRVGASTHLPLPWQPLGVAMHVDASYRFQQLGGDAQPAALWPKNRFQTVSLGASAEW